MVDQATQHDLPLHSLAICPLQRKICRQAEKVRSLSYNQTAQELAVLSSGFGDYIHCWDAITMRQIMSKKLPFTLENVCLTTNDEWQVYAVGSRANTDLLDSRTLHSVRSIASQKLGYGVRSVSFKGNLLTIGTGFGQILFWDLRACDFLESAVFPEKKASRREDEKMRATSQRSTATVTTKAVQCFLLEEDLCREMSKAVTLHSGNKSS